MSHDTETIPMRLAVNLGSEASLEKLDTMTRQLREELRGYTESASLARDEKAPDGTRVIDPVTLGGIIVTLSPIAIPPLIQFLDNWCRRAENRSVKIEIQRSKSQSVTIEVNGNIPPERLKEIMRIAKDV